MAAGGCAEGPTGTKRKDILDAGGYDLDLTYFVSWKKSSDRASGLVILDKTEDLGEGPTRGVRFCTIRITLPAELRSVTKEAIAKEFCEGPNSFVQKRLFPESIEHDWKRDADVREGDRVAIAYGGANKLSNQSDFISSSTIVRVVQRGRAFVWFPDRFIKDGQFFIVTGFETVVIPPGYSSDLTAVKMLLGAITPK